MGTHPIFESDFDCLTDLKSIKTCQDPLQPPMSVKAQKAEELPEQEVLDHKFDREEPEEHRLVKKITTNPSGQMGAGNMWKFYTEDSPGIKVGPVPVLVMSLMFIASVFILHIWGKYTRS